MLAINQAECSTLISLASCSPGVLANLSSTVALVTTDLRVMILKKGCGEVAMETWYVHTTLCRIHAWSIRLFYLRDSGCLWAQGYDATPQGLGMKATRAETGLKTRIWNVYLHFFPQYIAYIVQTHGEKQRRKKKKKNQKQAARGITDWSVWERLRNVSQIQFKSERANEIVFSNCSPFAKLFVNSVWL